MIPVLLLACALVSQHSALACTTDKDCGLLGDCISGVCACDPGWVGATCSTLDLLPAPTNAGLRQTNSSNWCGTVLRDETDADLYHGYFADFGGCANGLNIWLTGSRVIHATSSPSPAGPYTPVWQDGQAEVAVSAEAHNPQAIRAPDGTYLLLDSYDGPDANCPLEANYTTCKGGSSCRPKMPANGGLAWFIFHYSTSPTGPWLKVNTSMDYPCFSMNLTPSPFFHPNGTMYIVLHCDKDATHRMCDLTMVRSTGAGAGAWRGPFVRVNDRIWDSSNVSPHPEDPFFWIRSSPTTGAISYHVILHNSPVGIHLFSQDGLNFTLQQALHGKDPVAPFVFNETIVQTDGTSFKAQRRERPWLLFEKPWPNTRPVMLVNSMQAPVWPVVFTMAQQVK